MTIKELRQLKQIVYDKRTTEKLTRREQLKLSDLYLSLDTEIKALQIIDKHIKALQIIDKQISIEELGNE